MVTKRKTPQPASPAWLRRQQRPDTADVDFQRVQRGPAQPTVRAEPQAAPGQVAHALLGGRVIKHGG